MKPWEKNNKDPLFNEFYTTKETCEVVFSELIPIINEQTNKKKKLRVCCPCDGELSEIPKYLREHSDWEVDYFGDLDVNGEEARERMLKADVIITNPPFTMNVWRPFVEWLITNKKQFFIWGPLIQCGSFKLLKLILDYGMIYNCGTYMYNRPDGSQKQAITFFYTSYKVPVYEYNYKPIDEPQYYNNIPVYDRRSNIPPDYTGWMYVPITTLHYLQPLDIDDTKRGVPGKFIRVCVRRRSI